MKYLVSKFVLITSLMISCKESPLEKTLINDSTAASVKSEISLKTKESEVDITSGNNRIDTIKIDTIHHAILNLLTLIPDNSRGSWEWKLEDRLDMVTEALKNGYIIDADPQYMNILDITPHYFNFQVVDGTWCVATLEIDKNSKIIITNDHVGDGEDIHVYNYKDSIVNEILVGDIIPDITSIFMKDNPTCDSIIEDFYPILDIDFSQKNKIIITNPSKSYSNSERNCLNGNKAELVFNKNKKRFDVKSIHWQ